MVNVIVRSRVEKLFYRKQVRSKGLNKFIEDKIENYLLGIEVDARFSISDTV